MAARQEVFKRELYVQGACRFIVHQGATACDETFCNDPDSAPDWDDVIQVGIFHRGEQVGNMNRAREGEREAYIATMAARRR